MCAWRNRILLGGLLLHLAAPLHTQTVIRDRVVLTPAPSPAGPSPGGSPESFHTPCRPPAGDQGPPILHRYARYYGDSISLSFATCPACPAHHLSGVVTAGSEYVRLRLDGVPGLGGEVNGTSFHFREAWGYDVIAVFDAVPPADSAVVRFVFTYVDFPPPNQEIVEVYVVQPQYVTTADCDYCTVPHGSSIHITLGALDSCKGAYSGPLTYAAELVENPDLGLLHDPFTGARGVSLSGLRVGGGTDRGVVFESSGTDPDTIRSVRIRLTPSAPDIRPVGITLDVTPGPRCAKVTLVPDTLSPGDTATVKIQRMTLAGVVSEYPPGTLFTAAVYWGTDDLTLFSPSAPDTADRFEAVPAEGLRVIATGAGGGDGPQQISVWAYAHEPWYWRYGGAGKDSPGGGDGHRDRPFEFDPAGSGREGLEDCYVGWGVLQPRVHMILVGQTKYYQARPDPETADRLVIEEVSVPQLNGGIAEDVWGSNPVLDTGGDSAFVYWEKKYPVYSARDSFLHMSDLPAGLIRLIGRRNRPGAENRITLSAHSGGRSGQIRVEVKRPRFLGTSEFARRRSRGLDHEGRFYDVDSLCIWWGSLSGIPPQMIKGQYAAESVFDPDKGAFIPAYRYEPWTTQFDPLLRSKFMNGPFWTTWSSMGSGGSLPANHTTAYMRYPIQPKTVWQILEEHTNLVSDVPPYGGPSLFGSRNIGTGALQFDYKSPRLEYERIRVETYAKHGIPLATQNPFANHEALERFVRFMKYSYRTGLTNVVAQSRVASSYGPIQLMYHTAVSAGYNVSLSSIPEALNELDVFMNLAISHLTGLLSEVSDHAPSGNWLIGWEGATIEVCKSWNSKKSYRFSVLRNAKRFEPQ